MDLTDIYRIVYQTATECTFFSVAHRTFPKIDNIQGHKASLNKYKKTEITPCILPDHNGIKLEISSKIYKKYTNTGRLCLYDLVGHQRNKGRN
jgi:hypothetical protein